MRRITLLLAATATLLSGAQAASIKLRPQGDALTKAVQAALAQLSTKDIPMTLDTSSGPTLTMGGIGVSAAPFNPDVMARVVQVGAERRIEFNPQGPVPLAEALKQELMQELKLKEWTPTAAQMRFGGADLNGDGVIDLTDLAILMANYGLANPQMGDLNQDRKVDDQDVRLFTALYKLQPVSPVAPTTPTATPATQTAPAAPTNTAPTNTAPTNTTPTNQPPADQPATPPDKANPNPPVQPPTNPNPPAKP